MVMDINGDVNYLEYFDKALSSLDVAIEGTSFLSQMGPVLAGILIILFLIVCVIGTAAVIIFIFKKLPNMLT